MALKIHGTNSIQAGTVQAEILAAGVGGGPKITNIAVTDSSYTNLDDTAVGLSGGYIKITGTGFVNGCQVVVGATVATAVVFVSSTEVRAQIPAQSAGSYTLYLTNSDGGVAIRVNAVNYSSTPSWTTTSPLPNNQKNTSVSIQLTATSNSSVTYALQAGSSLPSGLSLSSSGLITGTTPDVANETTYNFTVVATDQENQDTPQAFQVTITVNDLYFEYVTLLLNNQTNNVLTDSSTNNFSLTAFGDTRASNFTPYETGWSVYFDGTGDYLSFGNNNPLPATGDFTFECWIYVPALPGVQAAIIANQNQSNRYMLWLTNTGGLTIQVGGSFSRSTGNNAVTANRWYHIATTRTGTTHNLFVDGTAATLTTSGSSPASIDNTEFFIGINYNSSYAFTGYISNFRIVTSILYTSTFTPSTSPLTAISGTNLLTCHTNRFLDGSTNNFTITRNGDARVTSFNPFGITNTGTTGSAYFDGTGDYLTAPGNNAFALTSVDWTIETWIYPTVLNTYNFIYSREGGTNPTSEIELYFGSNGALNLNVLVSSTLYSANTSAGAIVLNAWQHVAAVRNGGTVTIYINGISAATNTTLSTLSLNDPGTSYVPNIINQAAAANRGMQGYASNFRLVKGTAVYTTNFTPPTQPLTAIANTQLLTCQYKQPHNNHSFFDSSTNNYLITRSGNATQGTFSPFSQTGWSVYFNGNTGNYLTVSGGILGTSSNTFTIECWVYRLSSNSYGMLFGDATPAFYTNYWSFEVNSSNLLNFYWYDGGTKNVTGNTTIPINTWTHLALSVNNNAISLYVNGIQQTLSGTTTLTNRSGSNGYITIGQHGSPAVAYNGYISNLSFLSGTAKYSATFTPSSTKLLTNTINQQLLVCYGNNFNDFNTATSAKSISVTGTPQVQAFSPFNPTASWSAATYGGSGYFDGSGDYLSIADNDAFALGSNDWTIECWVYVSSLSAQGFIAQVASNGADSTLGFVLGINASGYPYVASYINGAYTAATASTAIVTNQWNHIAGSRASGTMGVFLNGSRLASTAVSGSSVNSTATVTVGASQSGSGALTTGYISGARIVNGTAVYSGTTYTVPTAPLTATTNTQLLLNFTNAGILDATSKNVLETVADAQINKTTAKWGNTSIKFDGTGDYLQMPDSELVEFGSADFTIEAWVYPTLITGTNRVILGHGTSGTQWLAFYIDANGYLTFYAYSSSAVIDRTATSRAVSLNTWTHVAVSRSGSTFRLFIDGSEPTYTGSPSTTSSAMPNFAVPFRIGAQRWDGDSGIFQGYIQDMRITKYARYTSNFTPPTTALQTQ